MNAAAPALCNTTTRQSGATNNERASQKVIDLTTAREAGISGEKEPDPGHQPRPKGQATPNTNNASGAPHGAASGTLDSLVSRFDAGATPEEIVQQFPSLGLAEVYALVAYVLSNRVAVDEYLATRARIGETVRAAVERRWSAEGIRERLLARRR